MGFEYQQNPNRRSHRLINTYTDEAIDHIYKQKAVLKIEVEQELEVLKTLLADLEKQRKAVSMEIENLELGWDDPKYDDLADEEFDYSEKISCIEDHIEALEELSERL